MRIISILALTVVLSACGTLGGAVSGAGDDLKTVGGWIKGK
jgi:predicted small secreted protein